MILSKSKGKIYQLRDGKDSRDFILEDIILKNNKYIVKCLFAKKIGEKPSVIEYLELEYFNKYAFKYGDDACFYFKNHYTHDWDYQFTPAPSGGGGRCYAFLTNCKKCGISVGYFDEEKKEYFSCEEMQIKDIIE